MDKRPDTFETMVEAARDGGIPACSLSNAICRSARCVTGDCIFSEFGVFKLSTQVMLVECSSEIAQHHLIYKLKQCQWTQHCKSIFAKRNFSQTMLLEFRFFRIRVKSHNFQKSSGTDQFRKDGNACGQQLGNLWFARGHGKGQPARYLWRIASSPAARFSAGLSPNADCPSVARADRQNHRTRIRMSSDKQSRAPARLFDTRTFPGTPLTNQHFPMLANNSWEQQIHASQF